ncbi:hypothetical protein D3C75_1051650 [compost metagenome]
MQHLQQVRYTITSLKLVYVLMLTSWLKLVLHVIRTNLRYYLVLVQPQFTHTLHMT